MAKKVLVIGGTGYLGQHLLQSFTENEQEEATTRFALAFTHFSNPPPQQLLDFVPQALPFHVDIRNRDGFDSISKMFGQPDVVINCAALSVPRVCEADPEAAMSINVPSALVEWISSFGSGKSLLIHLSTDQVYEGTKAYYKEDDVTLPVNVYGKSKVEAERFIAANCSNFAILRSSIIYGPQTFSPVLKSLPIQVLHFACISSYGYAYADPIANFLTIANSPKWMDGVLANGEEVEFFKDEYRCPIYVKDLVSIIKTLTNKWVSDSKPMQTVLNVGGPDRLSRVQMAEAVAHIKGYDALLIKPVSASSVDRGVKSPPDISMDIAKLVQTLGISPIPFKDDLSRGSVGDAVFDGYG